MRNLRKLTAAVLAIALVLTSMTATFAATTPANADKAATLKDLGLYAGTDATNVAAGLDGALTTQDSLIFLAKLFGYNDAASKLAADDVTKGLAKFADAKDVADYAKNVVAYSAINGILSGSTKDGKFFVGAKDTVTAARFATFMLKQMGYTVANFTESVAQLSEVKGSKVSATETGDLTRDAAVGIMYAALTAEKAAGTTVIADIVGTDAAKLAIATKAGLIVNTSTLDVASVSATNLRELVVTFNKVVPNVDEAKKTANYKIGSNNPEAVTLSDDNKTVTLRTSTTNAMGNYGTVDLTILKAVGFDADKVVKGIAIKDTTVPSALSVKTTGPKNIKVTLSEPLNENVTASNIAASLKIDSGLIAVDNSGVTLSGLELSLKTYSDLSEGSHKIEFLADKNLVDNAGYKLQASTLTFDYVKDTSALAFEVVESNETSVTIKFNKAIKTGTLAGNTDVKFTHTYNTSTNQVTGTRVTTTDDQKFVISFVNPFPPSTTTVYIDGADKILDNYGNKLATTSFAVTTTADLTKPTATAEFVDAKTVKVTYSEDVKNDVGANAANTVGNYVLKSGTDVVNITGITYDPADSKKIVKLGTAADALNGTTYTLTIKNVKDTSVAANQIDEVTLTFTGTDKVAPTVKTADSKLVAANKYKVVFSEAMDVATITSKSIYKLNGNALSDDDTVEAVDANKAALITFKNNITGAGNVITIGWIKDVAGNYSTTFSTPTIAFNTTVAKIGLDEYQITGKNAIKLKFADTLKDMVVTDFNYTTGAGAAMTTPDSLSVSIVDGATYITLVTKDLSNSVGTGIQVVSVGTTSAKNSFDTTLGFNTVADAKIIGDKCAPEKTGIALTDIADAKDTSAAMTLNTVAITYSEAIYAASVQDTDYTIAGYEVNNVSVAGNVVTLTVKTLDYGSFVKGTTEVKIKQVGEIQDTAKNALGAQDEWTAK